MRWLVAVVRRLARTVLRAPGGAAGQRARGGNELAREDDALDVWLDDDGMDASGL
jgi:hypothetical protein